MKTTQSGEVNWEALKADLEECSKETLVEMVNMWIQNYWSCQNYWVSYVERECGADVAAKLDGYVFAKTAKIQGKRLKALLGLGDDMQALAYVLKHTSPQWVPAGFEWEFIEVNDEEIKMRVRTCPMGTYRKSKGLEYFPCKIISPPLYTALASSVNPKIRAYCTHAHPDAPKENIMCEWHFVYENE